MYEKYAPSEVCFTVKTLSMSGVGDQLGTQFIRLMRLGQALGYRYVHTPPLFKRSQVPTLARRIAITATRRLGITLNDLKGDNLTRFLGLDRWKRNIFDPEMRQHELCDIQLDTLLGKDKHMNISDVREKLRSVYGANSKCIICFSWTPALYNKIAVLDALIGEPVVPPDSDDSFNFSVQYWERRRTWPVSSVFQSGKVRMVFHIRLGDSTAVDIAGQRILVFGDKILSKEEMLELMKIDPNRRPIHISEYRVILNALSRQFGQQRFSGILISDGYDRTFSIIRKALRAGHKALKGISDQDITISRRAANHELNDILSGFDDWVRIVGESESNLYDSIHALACAEIVIYGTGEFASKVHRLLRDPRTFSITVHVRDGVEKAVKKVSCFLDTYNGVCSPEST